MNHSGNQKKRLTLQLSGGGITGGIIGVRKTKDAYEKDWACEVTIPADIGNPTG